MRPWGPHPHIDDLPEDGEVDFEPRPAVRWLGARGMTVTGLQVALSVAFAQYADKRELQAALKVPEIIDLSERADLWFDWLADTGDGFEATYTTATLVARDELTATTSDGSGDDVRLPRAALLLLGGDLCYPAANPADYLNRFIGPYRAALPAVTEGSRPPQLVCIAGNHDWYDGLTTWLRLFCDGAPVGAWQTGQSRSYFVVKLPHRWWIMGIDLALDLFIDTPQLDYFRSVVAEQLQPGDRVILTMHEPSWLFGGLPSENARYSELSESNLRRFEREILHPSGVHVPLTIAGDIHHYNRYERKTGTQTRIVCGGGGTFLHPTQHIPDEILWPEADGVGHYELKARYPDAPTSRRLCWRTWLVPFLNPSFVAFVGVLYLLFAFAIRFSLVSERDIGFAEIAETVPLADVRNGLLYNPVSLVLMVGIWGAMIVFADCRRWHWRIVVGGLHGLAHLLVLTFVIWTAARLLAPLDLPFISFEFGFRWDVSFFLVAYIAVVLVVGGLAGAYTYAAYLFVMQRFFNRHTTDAFSAQRNPDYRSFLRLHLDEAGTLTVHPIGVKRVPRRWRYVPPSARSTHEPLFVPREEIVAHLIEPPFRVPSR
jgi:uncharacterized membrane protein YtjA (UPF0391 family)